MVLSDCLDNMNGNCCGECVRIDVAHNSWLLGLLSSWEILESVCCLVLMSLLRMQ